jgi:hypothetical protein
LSFRPTRALRRDVTRRLLEEMARAARRDGSWFALLDLSFVDPDREHAGRTIAESAGVPYIDCSSAQESDLTVPGDGHPNGKMHARYADCVERALGHEFRRLSETPPPRGRPIGSQPGAQ